MNNDEYRARVIESHNEAIARGEHILAAMTYERHTYERQFGMTPTRTHWGHGDCPCGCGEGGCSA